MDWRCKEWLEMPQHGRRRAHAVHSLEANHLALRHTNKFPQSLLRLVLKIPSHRAGIVRLVRGVRASCTGSECLGSFSDRPKRSGGELFTVNSVTLATLESILCAIAGAHLTGVGTARPRSATALVESAIWGRAQYIYAAAANRTVEGDKNLTTITTTAESKP